MWTLIVFLICVASVKAQLCLPCEAISCIGGECFNDQDGCAKCDGIIGPLTPAPARARRGACVIACRSATDTNPESEGLALCAEGYQCKSNGCGRTCQKIPDLPPPPARRGACVIACRSGTSTNILLEGLPLCPEGYECKFNGCGQTCQKIPDLPRPPARRGACVIACRSGTSTNILLEELPLCPEGYECKFNGCGQTCHKIPETRVRRGTCVEECDAGLWADLELPPCREGYECRSNGCGHTCQKIIVRSTTPGPL